MGRRVLRLSFRWRLLGWGAPLLQAIVVRNHWHLDDDHWFRRFFYFHNAPWYYLLKGRWLRHAPGGKAFASAILNVAGHPVLYRGFIDNFFCNPDGSLDRLILTEAVRRPFRVDCETGTTPNEPFQAIAGGKFVIRYSEVITLNVGFVDVTLPDMSETEFARLLEDDPIVEVTVDGKPAF